METGGRYLALDAGDAEDGESSTPFGEMPDMQKLTEAMEIIGDTPLDELSDAQLQQLEDAGVDLETLKDNESLLEGVRDTLPEEKGFPWPLVAGAVTVVRRDARLPPSSSIAAESAPNKLDRLLYISPKKAQRRYKALKGRQYRRCARLNRP